MVRSVHEVVRYADWHPVSPKGGGLSMFYCISYVTLLQGGHAVMCHAYPSLSIKRSVTSKTVCPVIILSRLQTSVMALPISQHEENY